MFVSYCRFTGDALQILPDQGVKFVKAKPRGYTSTKIHFETQREEVGKHLLKPSRVEMIIASREGSHPCFRREIIREFLVIEAPVKFVPGENKYGAARFGEINSRYGEGNYNRVRQDSHRRTRVTAVANIYNRSFIAPEWGGGRSGHVHKFKFV
ncbi:hypothetical protein HAX54_016791 [Datura stramonium]|uniref:Uncharacterized protein n=1 Tax=Datura stramonium TaxID=4076 RepID=A0ABS8ULU9_DATST|nr:hypothetical protein [Datura stramonium]